MHLLTMHVHVYIYVWMTITTEQIVGTSGNKGLKNGGGNRVGM